MFFPSRSLLGSIFLLLAIMGSYFEAYAQCQNPQTGTCSRTSLPRDFRLFRGAGPTGFAPLNPACGNDELAYFKPASGASAIMRLERGANYTFQFECTSTPSEAHLFIDYDGSGSWEPTETISLGTNLPILTPIRVSFTVPLTAILGYSVARFRIAAVGSFTNQPCLQNVSGSTIDYHCIIEDPSTSCSGPLGIVNLQASSRELCTTDSSLIMPAFAFAGSTLPLGSGLSFLWQESPDSLNWNTASGRNNGLSYSVVGSQVSSVSYYRLLVTCSTDGSFQPSRGIKLTRKSGPTCGCTPTNVATCVSSNLITSLTTNTGWSVSVPTDCRVNVYYDLRTSAPQLLTQQGTSFTFSGTHLPANASNYMLWIDYNQDGSYEATEATLVQAIPGVGFQGLVSVPASASLGITQARLTTTSGTTLAPHQACRPLLRGQSVDFSVNVFGAAPCMLLRPSISTDTTAICAGGTATLRVLDRAQLNNQVEFRWQLSTDAGATWNNPPSGINSSPTYTMNFSQVAGTDVWVRHQVSCLTGATSESNVIRMSASPAALCHCAPTHSTCVTREILAQITASGSGSLALAPAASCPSNGRGVFVFGSDARDTLFITDVVPTSMSVNLGPNAGALTLAVSLWIDYNRNGTFDTNEWFDLSRRLTGTTPVVTNVVHPMFGASGISKARIRTHITPFNNRNIHACGVFSSGHTYDFPVVLTATVSSAKKLMQNLEIWPNPAASSATLLHKNLSGTALAHIHSSTGQWIKTISLDLVQPQTILSLEGLAAGLYSIHVQTQEARQTLKLVVQP